MGVSCSTWLARRAIKKKNSVKLVTCLGPDVVGPIEDVASVVAEAAADQRETVGVFAAAARSRLQQFACPSKSTVSNSFLSSMCSRDCSSPEDTSKYCVGNEAVSFNSSSL